MTKAQSVRHKSLVKVNNRSRPISIFGVPVERDTIFSNHRGTYKMRVEKRQRKMIVKTSFIKMFLKSNERVLFLTTGYSPIGILEQLLTGPALLYFKRATFVFTNKRILHIPTHPDHGCHSALTQIMYHDCAQIQLKGRALIVSYHNGQQELFPYLGRKEKRKVKNLLESIEFDPEPNSKSQQRAYLCPCCTNILDKKSSVCPSCKMVFKSGLTAKLKTLLIPGGGYLYNRYALPGIAVGLLETALLSSVFYSLASFIAGRNVNLNLLSLLAALLIGEKFVAVFHSQKIIPDFIPDEKNFAMRKI